MVDIAENKPTHINNEKQPVVSHKTIINRHIYILEMRCSKTREFRHIERVHYLRANLDLEQVAPLVDGGAPPNVYNRWRVRLES